MPSSGTHQAGDDVEQGGLAGARRPDDRREARARGEAHVDRDALEPVANRDLEAHRRAAVRRASASAATSAPIETATESAASRHTPASPPGVCVSA